jgi:FtsH-binding integral membrane protein
VYPTPHPARPAQASSFVRHGVLALAAALCLAAAVAIWALLSGSFDDTSVRILLTGLAAALCTLGGLASSTALRLKNPDRRIGEVTIGLSQITLLLALALIWIPNATDSDTLARALGVTSVLMLAGAHASLLLARLRRRDTRTVHRLTRAAIVCATAAALLVSGLFVMSNGPIAPPVWRLLGVLVVLAVLNTLLVPLARKITRDSQHITGEAAKSAAPRR